jgi:ABC-type proline/glycine betaine transport system permease subunit
LVGHGFEVGIAIVVMAIILDRLTHAWAVRLQPPTPAH